MDIRIYKTKDEMGAAAAKTAATLIKTALDQRGEANIILATGASQFDMLSNLIKADIDWTKVTVFHLDEYIGMLITHPASFRKYMKERFVEKVKGLKIFNYVNGDAADPYAECKRLGALISKHPIDVACIGIGENSHIAFNDPPADFDTEEPYLVVNLDEACRKQQLGEGWFPDLNAVPKQAMSMSVKQIMKSKSIVCTVPDQRKSQAVKSSAEGPITNNVPGSILQKHAHCTLFLDDPAASLLGKRS